MQRCGSLTPPQEACPPCLLRRHCRYESQLGRRLYEGVSALPGLRIYGPLPSVPRGRVALASFSIEGVDMKARLGQGYCQYYSIVSKGGGGLTLGRPGLTCSMGALLAVQKLAQELDKQGIAVSAGFHRQAHWLSLEPGMQCLASMAAVGHSAEAQAQRLLQLQQELLSGPPPPACLCLQDQAAARAPGAGAHHACLCLHLHYPRRGAARLWSSVSAESCSWLGASAHGVLGLCQLEGGGWCPPAARHAVLGLQIDFFVAQVREAIPRAKPVGEKVRGQSAHATTSACNAPSCDACTPTLCLAGERSAVV